MVLLATNELAIDNLVALVPHETVQRLDDRLEVQALRNGIYPVLTLGTPVVVVGTLEDKTQTLRGKPNVPGLTPAKKVEGDLSEAIILAHVVHRVAPSVESAVEGLGACRLGVALHAPEALQARILGLADGVVEVELCGEVPLPVVRVLTTDVVRMHGEKCLIRSHARRSRIKEGHQKVELSSLRVSARRWKQTWKGDEAAGCEGRWTHHVTHRVFLESELLSEVEEDILDLLRRHGYLTFRGPGGIWLA